MKLFLLFIFLNLVYQTSYVLFITVPILSEIVLFHCISGVTWTGLSICQKKYQLNFMCVWDFLSCLEHSGGRNQLTLYTHQDICALKVICEVWQFLMTTDFLGFIEWTLYKFNHCSKGFKGIQKLWKQICSS